MPIYRLLRPAASIAILATALESGACRYPPPAYTIITDPVFGPNMPNYARNGYSQWWACVARPHPEPEAIMTIERKLPEDGVHTVRGTRLMIELGPYLNYTHEKAVLKVAHEIGHLYGLKDLREGNGGIPSLMSWKGPPVTGVTPEDCRMFCELWKCR